MWKERKGEVEKKRKEKELEPKYLVDGFCNSGKRFLEVKILEGRNAEEKSTFFFLAEQQEKKERN
jgi:hypothetical protein